MAFHILAELGLLSKPEIGLLRDQEMSTILSTVPLTKIQKGNNFNSLGTIRRDGWCPGPESNRHRISPEGF